MTKKKKREKTTFTAKAVKPKKFRETKPWKSRYPNSRAVGTDEALYEAWRQAVIERDGKQCQWLDCKVRMRLQVHHVKTWAGNPGLRYSVDNGICLCVSHHKLIKGDEQRYECVFMARVARNKFKGKI